MSLGAYTLKKMYDALGHTGNEYYVRFVHYINPLIWDDVAKELVADPAWEDSAILLVEEGLTGAFPIVVPALLPAGRYDYIVYKIGGSTPQNTDDVVKQETFQKGEEFGF